jgi:hypothetical protein
LVLIQVAPILRHILAFKQLIGLSAVPPCFNLGRDLVAVINDFNTELTASKRQDLDSAKIRRLDERESSPLIFLPAVVAVLSRFI